MPQQTTGPNAQQPPVSGVARGATVQSYYAEREMKIYPVAEHEVESLTTMNTLNTVLLTVGVGLISLAAGIWVTYLFTAQETPEGEVLAKFFAWILAALGILCFFLCRWTTNKRNATWGKIVKDSKGGD